jgi:hypothetical protein
MFLFLKKTPTLIACILLTISQLDAQSGIEPIFVGTDAPAWMQLLAAPDPNVFEVQAAYEAYYRERPFEKNNYTQYYKRWMRWARPYTQGDGSLRLPTAAQQADHEARLVATRRTSHELTGLSDRTAMGWTFKAPVRTTDVDGTTPVTWQTNIYSLDIAPSNANILYAGGESGGIWKTTDKGLNWTLLSAGITHGAVGAVKIHPTNPDIAYACTNGKIVKTTNGGSSWTTVYTAASLWVNALAISDADPNIVLAAANQGLIRTTNGGTAWSVLHTNQTWDVDFKIGDATTVFCIRKNGGSSDFMRSTNGGASFVAQPTGWWVPGTGESVTGAHIGVCPSSSSKIYAYLCGSGTNLAGYVGVFVSNDGGTSWANTHPSGAVGNAPTPYAVPSHTNLMTSNGTTGLEQGFYDMALIVNPANSQQLIAGGTSWWRSNDGGVTWAALGSYAGGLAWSHPDMQALAVSGTDLWIATDGGLDYSSNWATSITARMNGITGSDMWGFDSGWNDDYLVGGRYHNGNMGWSETFGTDISYRLGGAESPTGYVNPGPGRKSYFSDIGGVALNGGLTGGVTEFSFTFEPTESYAYYANSELVWDPRCWNIVYAGKDNKIWRSEDGGTSFAALYTFPGNTDNKVYDIEVARSNPQVLYCSQWDGTDDKIWRSTNGGVSWSACTALPLPNNNDRVKLAVAAEDANVLWVGLTYGSNGKKVYKSTDGGTTWTNLTTSVLDNFRVTNIMAQYGTNGGIYVGTDGGVFYRNNTHTNWQPYSTNLPLSAETNRLKPFYRDGKIRNGCWGFGIWEAPLFEPSAVIAQAMSSSLESKCTRDTVYFDDYSVAEHAGASWSWAFSPAPSYVSSTNVRNPKVVFGASGTYTATMTLTKNGTPYTSTLSITVDNACAPDSIPDQAVVLGGNDDPGAVVLPSLGITTNTFSVTAWVKPDGIQPDYSAIFMSDGSEAAGFNFREGNNTLGYHWPGGQWWWDSNLIVPADEWSHVAFVVDGASPTKTIAVYVNGIKATHNVTPAAVNFNSTAQLGKYRDWGDRHMKGEIEEVVIWNKVLTQNEIREQMHLPHVPANEPGLLAYYQFNEPSGQVLDRAGSRHAGMAGSAARLSSSCPMGPGNSHRMSVTNGGAKVFGQTGLTLTFPAAGPYPNGELVATRINWTPHLTPATADPLSPCYWVIRNYGTNSTFAVLSSIQFAGIGNVPAVSTPNQYRFFKRSNNAFGSTWGSPQDVAEALTYGTNGAATFSLGNGITSFSQFIVAKPASALPVEWLFFDLKKIENQQVRLDWATATEQNTAWHAVERSRDGFQFEEIGRVPAAGQSTTRRDYTWTDQQAVDAAATARQTVFYRIRQIDQDGREAYTNIRSVDFLNKNAAPSAGIFPNPAVAGSQLQVWADTPDECIVRVYDAKGRAVRVQRFSEKTSLALGDLAAGTYAWRIESGQHIWTGRVLVR